jgi:hypothetical protein
MKSSQAKLIQLFLVVTIFSIAMGLLESAVVVYLREIYYKTGFRFPLVPIDKNIGTVELFRELATIIMLLSIGYLAGKNITSRFAWFIYSFAIWDIFYYIFLKVFVNWPDSLMTNDILFLIPVVWVGPVITPVIVSLTMILFAMLILYFEDKYGGIRFSFLDWTILILGSLILIVAFSWDYIQYVLKYLSFREIWITPGSKLFDLQSQYIPEKFNWFLFSLGEIIIFYRIIWFWIKNKKQVNG